MNCVILDDEPFAHQVLGHYIAQMPNLRLVASFRNSVEAYEYLNKNKIDLLFLDIEMPLINGISFLKALKDPPKTIFTTAYKEFAFEGFELGVIDYLLKPFSHERFVLAIAKLNVGSSPVESFSDHFVVKEKDSLLNIKQQDILYFEGCKDYIKVITNTKVHVVYHTLKGVLHKLKPDLFLQSHRSYIVNKNHILRIVSDKVLLTDKTYLPIGQSFKKEFLAKLKG
jgi:two-component system response regulator LytT